MTVQSTNIYYLLPLICGKNLSKINFDGLELINNENALGLKENYILMYFFRM